MPSIEWDESMAVGVARIDDQHRELARRFRDCLHTIGAGRPLGVFPSAHGVF